MATSRSYGDGCRFAHALDLIGERWALLVVRELLLGPKRFSNLRAGLPQASPNVLSQRLKELEANGVINRHRLGPPVGAWVYELTPWGLELEPIVTDLARWGDRAPEPPASHEIGTDATVLALRTLFDADAAAGTTISCELQIADDRFTIRVAERRLWLARGAADEPDAVIDTTAQTLIALITGQGGFDEAIRRGDLSIDGEEEAVRHLLELFTVPQGVSAA